jgi:cytosine/adenosine deaminase-related metal-dependent hydrolase
MWLCNLHTTAHNSTVNICVQNGLIQSVTADAPSATALTLEFENATVIPGLINSHDHLDFNLFPRLGNRVYANYTEWGMDIHQQHASIIAAVTKIPAALRAEWGIYKNLLAGVTTVVNHGQPLQCSNDIITVFQKTKALHSAAFEKNWKYKLNNPLAAKYPVVIHAGEGTDAAANREITELIKWNKLGRTLVAVHGVAMNTAQAKKFKALVWCPDSNFFLLNKTADISSLAAHIPVLFGTDSTLTASWNIWEQLRLATQTGLLSNDALLQSLTATPAAIWQLNSGYISAGKDADIVIVQSGSKTTAAGLFETNPEDILLVLHKGAVRLLDDSLRHKLPQQQLASFSSITINNSKKLVYGNLPALVQQLLNYYPHATFPFTVN